MNNEKVDTSNKETDIINIINDLRYYLNADGGDIEYIKLENDYVYIKLYGACSHCEYQDITLNDNILLIIQEKYPDVKGVINVEI